MSARDTHVDVLAAISKLGEAITPALNPHQIGAIFIEQCRESTDAESGSVFVFENGGLVHLVTVPQRSEGSASELSNVGSAEVLLDKESFECFLTGEHGFVYSTRSSVQELLRDDRVVSHLGSPSSLMAIPIGVGVTRVGVAVLASSSANAFSKEDLALISTLGTSLGPFLHTARVSSKLVEVVITTGMTNLVEQVVQRLPELVGATDCSLFLRKEPGKGDACLVATHGLSQELVQTEFFAARERSSGKKASYAPGEGLTGWVLQTGRSLRLNTHRTKQEREEAVNSLNKGFLEEGLPQLRWKAKYRESFSEVPPASDVENEFAQRAWIGVPLLSENGEVSGVLRISRDKDSDFTKEDDQVLLACSRVVSLTILRQASEIQIQPVIPDVVAALATAIDAKDPYTEQHSHNVQRMSFEIGKRMSLSQGKLRELEMAAILHDIGKIGIPDVILSKPGIYNIAEIRTMEMHPVLGSDILKRIPGMERIREGVAQHHERLDGTGYPLGLKGDEISLYGRIIAVADSFDAMIARRPYKEKMSYKMAFSELEADAGTKYDKKVVEAFVDAFGAIFRIQYPPHRSSRQEEP